ncbi:MAG: hypothetical protein IPP69_13975 [Flavobacteriales bacterium]|nr:hypothetical protein [Flavobacteriales bacterium]
MEETKIVEFYKTLLENQSSNYSILITAFIALTAILVGSTWLWNFLVAKNQIKNAVLTQVKSVEQSLNKKYDKVIEDKVKELEDKYDRKMLTTEADLARIFAIHCENTNDIQNAIDWWASALDKFIAAESDDMIRLVIDSLNRLALLPDLNEHINKDTFTPEFHIEIVKKAPLLLEREKMTIIKVLGNYKTT